MGMMLRGTKVTRKLEVGGTADLVQYLNLLIKIHSLESYDKGSAMRVIFSGLDGQIQ